MAADIAQLKPIIVVCTVIALSFLLISWIPNGFYTADDTERTLEAPGYFSAVEIEQYGDYFNYTLDGTDAKSLGNYYYITPNVGGHTLDIWYAIANTSTTGFMNIFHCEVWAGIIVNKHAMDFIYNGHNIGWAISKAHLDSSDLEYEFQCNHINLDLFLAYNDTAYSSPTDALDHNELILLIGVEWDEMATGMSAWDFVAAIMFFNLPDTHWMLNAIIAVPLWIGLLYASVTIILTILDLLPFT